MVLLFAPKIDCSSSDLFFNSINSFWRASFSEGSPFFPLAVLDSFESFDTDDTELTCLVIDLSGVVAREFDLEGKFMNYEEPKHLQMFPIDLDVI